MTSFQTNAQGSLAEKQLHFTPPKSHRFVFLDSLRGIAALFVVAFHFPRSITASFVHNGPLSVDFFFCLSGFVIAFSYEERLNETISFKDFAVARWIRLYPIYGLGSLIGLTLGIMVQHFVLHIDWCWLHWTHLFTLALLLWPTRWSSIHSFENYPLDGPAWSLFYEILANLVYAVLVKLRLARTAVLLCIVACSLAILMKVVANGGILDLGPTQIGFDLGFARVALSFFLGVLICRVYRLRTKIANARKSHWILAAILSSALILIIVAPFAWMRAESFHLMAIGVCFPLIVYYGAISRLPRISARSATALGELSYPLYLLHLPFVELLRARRILKFEAAHPTILHCLIPFVMAIFAYAAWWVGEHIDLPIRRMLTRRYNSYKQSRPAPVHLQA